MKKLAALIVGTLLACGGGGADLEAFLKLDTEKGEAFAAGGDDCAVKAKSVREWRSNNNAKYKEMQDKLKEKYPDGPPKDLMEKHGAQIKKNKKAVMDAMFACTSKSKEFDAAIDETK